MKTNENGCQKKINTDEYPYLKPWSGVYNRFEDSWQSADADLPKSFSAIWGKLQTRADEIGM